MTADFFQPNADSFILELIEEEIYQVYLVDILEYFTDPSVGNSYQKDIPELRIIEVNFIGGCSQFQIPGQPDTLCAGAAFVRLKDEITIMGVFGKVSTDEKISNFSEGDHTIFPGKEFLDLRNADMSNESFFDIPGYAPVILFSRVSLDGHVQVRYIFHEKKGAFRVFTDDPTLISDLKSVNANEKEIIDASNREIDANAALFNLLLQFPKFSGFAAANEDSTAIERHPTKFKIEQNATYIRKIRSGLDAEYVPNYVNVHTIALREPNPATFTLSASGLKMESSGFWKRLSSDSVGRNREGHEVHGKTWVATQKAWYEMAGVQIAGLPQDVAVSVAEKVEEGYVYVMRNPQHPRDVYKVGFTLRDPEERADDLSSTSGQPDYFSVIQSWKVRGPKLVEQHVHRLLSEHRVTDRREFFKVKYSEIRGVIERVIESTKSDVQK